jgi:hypothetical protein
MRINIMPNLSQRYIAALAELSQFSYAKRNKSKLTHILTGAQISPETDDENAIDTNYVHLTFVGGHSVEVDVSHFMELMLVEDASHRCRANGGDQGEIHEVANKTWLYLAEKHQLLE